MPMLRCLIKSIRLCEDYSKDYFVRLDTSTLLQPLLRREGISKDYFVLFFCSITLQKREIHPFFVKKKEEKKLG